MNPLLRFWGVRGSFPAALESCRSLGGNTSCVELEWQGHHLILDAGTGIRKLGKRLMSQPPERPLHLVLTHPHWDHIQGFPFFAPAYSPAIQLRVHSMKRATPMRSLLADQQEATFFSVPLQKMQSELSFPEWEEGETFEAGPFRITPWRVNHPGTCCGYRIEAGSRVLAFIPDIAPCAELLLADPLPGRPTRERSLQILQENQFRLAEGADLVIYDTFFTPEQYAQRSHWGHSTLEQAVEVCTAAAARQLIMFHHNSEISDDEQLLRLRSLAPTASLEITLAREGEERELPACA